MLRACRLVASVSRIPLFSCRTARVQLVSFWRPWCATPRNCELQEIFGEEHVGLRTGDVSINGGAAILVMTTEILRNITYRAQLEEGAGQDLSDVGLTVLDEVHYLGHPDRGSVWEEVIINSPPEMQLLAMSATVANAAEIGDWVTAVHGPCTTIETAFRPVPLTWNFAWDDENAETIGSSLAPLLADRRDGAIAVNPALKAPNKRALAKLRRQIRSAQRRLEAASGREDVEDLHEYQMLVSELASLEVRSRPPCVRARQPRGALPTSLCLM